jgi:4-aminobutyrate aminotransferase
MLEAFRRGLLVLTCGKSTIRLCPPLVVTRDEVDRAMDIFKSAIESVYQG